MKKIIAIIAVVAVIAAGVGLYIHFNPADEPKGGEKNITLEISADGTSETYEVTTGAQMLGKMLVEEGYVKNDRGDYGLYIQTVYGPFEGGRTADSSSEEWWSITKNGETVMTGADETPLADGEKYELTLKVGYDNF
ncbi:MAG: DUF4430 domain-containing protein [Clostridia bacterium]|nr:DUF4430 domain-containing protein [Clostridia bacterium]